MAQQEEKKQGGERGKTPIDIKTLIGISLEKKKLTEDEITEIENRRLTENKAVMSIDRHFRCLIC